MVYNTHLAKQAPSNRIISQVFFYRYCDRVHHFPLMCFPGVLDAPIDLLPYRFLKLQLILWQLSLFHPCFCLPLFPIVCRTFSCDCISKLPWTSSLKKFLKTWSSFQKQTTQSFIIILSRQSIRRQFSRCGHKLYSCTVYFCCGMH